jgi:hypothetical protein
MFLNSWRCFGSSNSDSSSVEMGMPISVMSLRLSSRGQRLRVVVEQVAAGLQARDVLGVGLGVHGHHDVDALAPAEVAVFVDPHLEPGGQALDVRRKDVAGGHRNAHAEQRLGEHAVGAGRTGAVDVGETDDEIVVQGAHLDLPFSVGSLGQAFGERAELMERG